MAKKSTQWITIPDETVHTPASHAGSRKGEPAPVKHKWFWAIGFVVVIVAAFGMLAPQQFATLLQGNLFDAPGVESPELEQDIGGLEILSTGVDVDVNIDAGVETISDCDKDCFEEKYSTCSPATHVLKVLDNVIYEYKILGPDGNDCEVQSKFIANPNTDWIGKEMVCKYNYTTQDFSAVLTDFSNCSGELFALMNDSGNDVVEEDIVVQPETEAVSIQIEPVGEAESIDIELETEPEAPDTEETEVAAAETEEPSDSLEEELDANQQLLEELRKEIAQLQGQAQPLPTPTVVPTGYPIGSPIGAPIGGVYPSAPAAVGVTTSIGTQPPGAQPGYRVNTHRVAVHPQTVLQQNLSGGYIAAPVVTTAPTAVPTYAYADYSAVQATPGSGPREVMLVAFLMTFFALLGWKALRLSRG